MHTLSAPITQTSISTISITGLSLDLLASKASISVVTNLGDSYSLTVTNGTCQGLRSNGTGLEVFTTEVADGLDRVSAAFKSDPSTAVGVAAVEAVLLAASLLPA